MASVSQSNLGARRAPGPAPRWQAPPDALLYAILALSWVTIWRVQDILPVLGKVQLPIITEASVIILLAADTRPDRRFKWIASPILWCVAGLLTLMLLGLPFSLWRGWSFTFILRDYGPTLLLLVALSSSLRNMRDVEWFCFAHLCGAALYVLDIYLFFPVVNGRLAGAILYDANDLTLLITCSIPFAIFFLRRGQILRRRVIALAALVLFVMMTIRAGSRGGFLALVAVGLYLLLFYSAFPKRTRIAAISFAIVLFGTFASSQYWHMMDTIVHPKNDYNMTSEEGRKAIWKRGIGYMLARPVLGVGVRAFPQAEGMLSKIAKQYNAQDRGLKWSIAHNSFVETGAELGVGGLVLLLTMITAAFRTLDRVRKRSASGDGVTQADAILAQTLTASLIAFCIAGFFVSAEYFAYFYVLLGLVVAQQAILRRRWASTSREAVSAAPRIEQGAPRSRRAPALSRSAVASTWFPPA